MVDLPGCRCLKIKTCVLGARQCPKSITLQSLRAGGHPYDDTNRRRHAGSVRKPHHKDKAPSPQAQQILRELSQKFATR